MQDCFEEKVFQKNEILLSSGQVCRHLYFVQQGSLRGYYILDGKEVTHWFAVENDFVTSFHSFITRQPAVPNSVALKLHLVINGRFSLTP
ncbi:MAG: cyclic nucleotide-binding domain-containing protein [Proteobacteria bacterium]|nr:MAG: cyclic nucleotide-binding domain-containing protein [Pseudomonadota bacterium]